MSERNGLNRRNVLKKLGASGLAVAGMSNIVAGERYSPTADRRKSVLADPQVQSIHDAVGGFEVEEISEKQIRVGSSGLTATEVKTSLGTLVQGEMESGEKDVKLTTNLSEVPQLRSRFSEGRHSAPDTTDLTVWGRKNSVTLTRPASEEEVERLRQATGHSGDVFMAHYDTDIGGFAVGAGQSYESLQRYQVGVDGRAISSENTEPLITTNATCTGSCLQCFAAVGGRVACYVSCAGVVTGVGAAACLACLGFATVGLISCGDCADLC